YLHHRQRMVLIEKGMATTVLPPTPAKVNSSLRFGLIAIALGLAVFISQIFEVLFHGWGEEDSFAIGSILVGVALLLHSWLGRKAGAGGGQKEGNLTLTRAGE
ncbi:MAG: hypothetical protein ONB49_13730, partial [candidate division KSB1 bacterium]|nr:hypothetical protein [candidate division KSB1 bacterium]